MHGRKRAEYKARLSDAKIAAGLAQKAKQWNVLSHELLQRRGRHDPKQDTLELTAKLLQVNPDPSHLWNHRRELLTGEDKFDIDIELTLTQACLERNPKSYGAWFHRKWSLCEMLQKANKDSTTILQKELGLCALLLKQDERNFHGWNYRRFVVASMAYNSRINDATPPLDGSWNWKYGNHDENESHVVTMGPQVAHSHQTSDFIVIPQEVVHSLILQEWDFSHAKIQENFSNFSAFHYRSKLLPKVVELQDASRVIQDELELIQNAIFTEPDDQTAWWYLRFVLLEFASLHYDRKARVDLLQEQVALLGDLVETENGNCKWGLLTLHSIHCTLNDLLPEDCHFKQQANLCLERVAALDPDRAGRYQGLST